LCCHIFILFYKRQKKKTHLLYCRKYAKILQNRKGAPELQNGNLPQSCNYNKKNLL